MEIITKGIMSIGLLGAILADSAGIELCHIVDGHITVLQRKDGTFGFKDHNTGKEPPKKVQKDIIKAIKEKENAKN